METKFDPAKFEAKWQKKWQEDNIYKTGSSSDKKIYILDMFPYPSGDGLHVGHVRGYTATDILARYYRMNGYSVLHPMGWDAFGLPAENAAIKQKTVPQKLIPGYIANFKAQMQMMGLSYDWTREFATTDPNYFKWTQWLFIQFFKMGLLYKKETPIYFCPVCKTGLAQEEVLADGTHERCGNKVEERTLPQWIFRITKYADRLLDDLEPPSSRDKSETSVGPSGLDWPTGILEQQRNWIGKKTEKGEVTYHLRDWIFSRQRYWGEPIPMIFCEKCAEAKISYWKFSNSNLESRNSKQSNQNNQRNNGTNQKTSKWVEEVEEDLYGWFPVNDEQLPVELPKVDSYQPTVTGESPLSQIASFVNTTCPNCGGPATRETDTMPNWAGSCWYYLYFAGSHPESFDPAQDKLSEGSTNVIPVPRPVPNAVLGKTGIQDSNMDPRLREDDKLDMNENKIGPTNIENWKLKIKNSGNHWLPVDWYIGGAEHAVLHLLYARFWMKAMFDLDLVKASEPFKKMINVGLIIAEDGRKMSKSKGNVINPNDIVNRFGADTLRLYEMFMAPFNQEVAWSTEAIGGSARFLRRIWQIYQGYANGTVDSKNDNLDLSDELQRLIIKVTSDITNVKFNTAISGMMTFLNRWEGQTLSSENAKIFLKLLSPFAPYTTEEIWQSAFDEKSSIHLEAWPHPKTLDKTREMVTIPVQINGKVRDTINISFDDISESSVTKKALAQETIKKWLNGKKYETIYVSGKILNLVLEI